MPSGLSLPEGWTLLPLQRLPNNPSPFQTPAASPQNSMSWTANSATAPEARTMPSVPTATGSGQLRTNTTISSVPTSNSSENVRANMVTPESSNRCAGQISQSDSVSRPDPTEATHPNSLGWTSQSDDKEGEEKFQRQGEDGPSASLSHCGSGSAEEETKARTQPAPSSAASDWDSDDSDGETTASSTHRTIEKGKGKATTVEDSAEDVD